MNLERESGRIFINNIKKIKKLWVEAGREGGGREGSRWGNGKGNVWKERICKFK